MNSRQTAFPAPLPGAEHPGDDARLPALTALGVQLVAGMAVLLLAAGWQRAGLMQPLGLWVVLQGCFAIALAYLAGMDRWWLPIHLLFVPLAALAWSWHLPPSVSFAAFLGLMLVHGATYRTRVPTHLSRRAAVEVVAGLLPVQPGFRCLDLGCGTGGVLALFSGLRPEGRYAGVEGALLPFVISWLRGRWHGFPVRFGDLWKEDLSTYDVVYAFLSPASMPRLWQKAVAEMRPGTLLISNEFLIPGVPPALSIHPEGSGRAPVHVWRLPPPC